MPSIVSSRSNTLWTAWAIFLGSPSSWDICFFKHFPWTVSWMKEQQIILKVVVSCCICPLVSVDQHNNNVLSSQRRLKNSPAQKLNSAGEVTGMHVWKGSYILQMLVFLVLFLGLQPHIVCKAPSAHPILKSHSITCRGRDPFPFHHEFYHPGDIIIGNIASQFFVKRTYSNFSEYPSQMWIKNVM